MLEQISALFHEYDLWSRHIITAAAGENGQLNFSFTSLLLACLVSFAIGYLWRSSAARGKEISSATAGIYATYE